MLRPPYYYLSTHCRAVIDAIDDGIVPEICGDLHKKQGQLELRSTSVVTLTQLQVTYLIVRDIEQRQQFKCAEGSR